jgi:hypothetical protein
VSCHCCGAAAKAITIVKDDVVVAVGALCDLCLDAALEHAAQEREIFEGLLASGVSREEANRIMIARIDNPPVPA